MSGHSATHAVSLGVRFGVRFARVLLVAFVLAAGTALSASAAFEMRAVPFALERESNARPSQEWAVTTRQPFSIPELGWHDLTYRRRGDRTAIESGVSVLTAPGYREWNARIAASVAGWADVAVDGFAVDVDPADGAAPPSRHWAASLSLGRTERFGPARARLFARDLLRAGASRELGIAAVPGFQLGWRFDRDWNLEWERTWPRVGATVSPLDRVGLSWRPLPALRLAHVLESGRRSESSLEIRSGSWSIAFHWSHSDAGLDPTPGATLALSLPMHGGADPPRGAPQRETVHPIGWTGEIEPPSDAIFETWDEPDTLWARTDSLVAESILGARWNGRADMERWRVVLPPAGHREGGAAEAHAPVEGTAAAAHAPLEAAEAGAHVPTEGTAVESHASLDPRVIEALGLRSDRVRALGRFLEARPGGLHAVGDLPDTLQPVFLTLAPVLDPASLHRLRHPGLESVGTTEPGLARNLGMTRAPVHADGRAIDILVLLRGDLRLRRGNEPALRFRSALESRTPAGEIGVGLRHERGRVPRIEHARWRTRDVEVVWSEQPVVARWGSGLLPATASESALLSSGTTTSASPFRSRGPRRDRVSSVWVSWAPRAGLDLWAGSVAGRRVVAVRRTLGRGVAAGLAGSGGRSGSDALSGWAAVGRGPSAARVECVRHAQSGFHLAVSLRHRGEAWRIPWKGSLDLSESIGDRARARDVSFSDLGDGPVSGLLHGSDGHLLQARRATLQLRPSAGSVSVFWDHQRRREGPDPRAKAVEWRQVRLRSAGDLGRQRWELRFVRLQRQRRSEAEGELLHAERARRTVQTQLRLRLRRRPADGSGVERGIEMGWSERGRDLSAGHRVEAGSWIGVWMEGLVFPDLTWSAGALHLASVPAGSRVSPSWAPGLRVPRDLELPFVAAELLLRFGPGRRGRVQLRVGCPLDGDLERGDLTLATRLAVP